MYASATKSYQQVNVFTANPLRLILMCYDGAIGSLKLARQSYIAKEYEAKAKALQKAMEIIHELNFSLDLERGGAIARSLRSLYLYMIRILREADLKKDIDKFSEVIRMLEELESGWKEIASGSNAETWQVLGKVPASGAKGASAGQAWSV